MKILKSPLGILLFVVFAPTITSSVSAGEEELWPFYNDEEFVSIATGISQPISKAPSVASVITSEQIRSIGATDIDEVLESVPGLHIARSAVGYNSIYVFRGIYTELNPQVLMLINGFPLTNLFQGDRNLAWAGMPVEAISRIEIIRGPGSALFGADAFAGVINIVTKGSDEISTPQTGAKYGSNNTKSIWLNYGKQLEQLTFSASIEIFKTDGQNNKIDFDAQDFLDSISGTDASLAPASINLQRENIDARAQLDYGHLTLRTGAQIRNNAGIGVGAAQALDSQGKISSDRYNFDLTYDNVNFTENIDAKISASYLHTTQEVNDDILLYPPGSRGPFFDLTGTPLFPPFPEGVIGNPEVYENHYRANANITYLGIERHQLTIGAGYYYGEVSKTEEEKNFGIDPTTGLPILPGSPLIEVSDTPYVFLPEDNRENSHVFIQDVWHFANDWELTAGVRYDHYSDFGDTVNPRLALVWSTLHNLTTKLLYGEAFRAPSFGETRVQSNPAVLGNPNLEPETLKSYEIAFNYKPTFDLTLDLNIFRYKWKDIIQYVTDISGGTRTAQNEGEQNGHGIEFEAHWEVNDWLTVLTNYSWQDSEDENTDTDAANAPEQQFYIRGMAELPHEVDLNIQVNSVMDRNRAFGDVRSDIDDYTTVDVTLRKRFAGDQLELSLLAKNLFDEDAFEPSLNATPVPLIPNDLPLAGRRILGEVRYKFN